LAPKLYETTMKLYVGVVPEAIMRFLFYRTVCCSIFFCRWISHTSYNL